MNGNKKENKQRNEDIKGNRNAKKIKKKEGMLKIRRNKIT